MAFKLLLTAVKPEYAVKHFLLQINNNNNNNNK